MDEQENSSAEQHDPEERPGQISVNDPSAAKRRNTWRIVIAAVCVIVLLRETGVLGLNFYVSKSSASYLASFSGPPIKKKEDGGCRC